MREAGVPDGTEWAAVPPGRLPPFRCPAIPCCQRSAVQIDSTLWVVTIVVLVLVFTLDFFLAVRKAPCRLDARGIALDRLLRTAAAIAFGCSSPLSSAAPMPASSTQAG